MDIDWSLYASDLFMDGFLRYVQLIALGAVVSVLVNNRLVAHVVSLLLFTALWVAYQADSVSHLPALYSFLPGSDHYSDLIGYGAYASSRVLVHVMWWGLAGVFATIALLFWHRGTPVSLAIRLYEGRRRFNRGYASATVAFLLLFALMVYQIQQAATSLTPGRQPTIRYASSTAVVRSIRGQTIAIKVQHHHPYQTQYLVKSAQKALQRGERLFGAYPYPVLRIVETPKTGAAVRSERGRILFAEHTGWTADPRQPDQLDYLDYLIHQEVFNQWLRHRLQPRHEPGNGFLRQSLAEYLALQVVAKQYGPKRLRQRLAQRFDRYAIGRGRSRQPASSLLRSRHSGPLERDRAALVLSSIGQVWGDGPLSLTIGQFYKQAIQKPESATADAFATQLTKRLPDSLQYLTTYLREPLWFDFRLGRVSNLVNGLSVEVIATKWREATPGVRQQVPINDYVPIVVLDGKGREIYRKLAHPNPDEREVQFPPLTNAHSVLIDPLGTWTEAHKHDNYKILN